MLLLRQLKYDDRVNEVEPVMGIAARRIVDAAEGRGLASVEADMIEAGRKSQGKNAR